MADHTSMVGSSVAPAVALELPSRERDCPGSVGTDCFTQSDAAGGAAFVHGEGD